MQIVSSSQKSSSRESTPRSFITFGEQNEDGSEPPYLELGKLYSLRNVDFDPYKRALCTKGKCREIAEMYRELVQNEPEVLTPETADKMVDDMVRKIAHKLGAVSRLCKNISNAGKITYKDTTAALKKNKHEEVSKVVGNLSQKNTRLVNFFCCIEEENQHFRREDYEDFVKPRWFDPDNTEFFDDFYGEISDGLSGLHRDTETPITDKMDLPAVAEVELKIYE